MTAILFNSLFPITWVILISVLVLCLLGWLEVKRNQKLLFARFFALLLAILSIVCLILNPSLSIKKSADIILLTPGYRTEKLDSFLQANPKSQLYKIKDTPGLNTANEIDNYRDLSDLKGNIFVLGEGLPQYMLDYVDTTSLFHFPSSVPEGLIGINANKIFTANQLAELRGVVNIKGTHTLKLTGPGTAEDSIRIDAKNSQPFTLAFRPKTAGLYSYTLTASDSSGKIRYSEQVPVQVKEQKRLSILFLSDYPSAEIRFLKNFLETKNHKLTLRYKISKDKYRTEFVNIPPEPIGRLNAKLLQRFDMVLTDASSLTSLSTSEIQELKKAIKDGLGMLTLINTPVLAKQANDILDFTINKIKNDSAQMLVNKQLLKIQASPVTISSGRNLFNVQREITGRIISGYYQSGLGKSGFQLLTNTFSLALAGEKDAYAGIWSPLIEAIARRDIKQYELSFITPFPYYPDEPLEFKIVGSIEKPILRMDSVQVPLIEDPFIKNVWFGKIWTGQQGWNSLYIDQDSSRYNFLVSQPDEWRSLQAINQLNGMKKISSKKIPDTAQQVIQPVPRLIFFLMLLFSAGFLWLAPKL